MAQVMIQAWELSAKTQISTAMKLIFHENEIASANHINLFYTKLTIKRRLFRENKMLELKKKVTDDRVSESALVELICCVL